MRHIASFIVYSILSTISYGATFSTVKVGPSTPIDISAALEVQSTTQAILFPRMTTTQKNAIVGAKNGDIVYDTTLGTFSGYQSGNWSTLGGGVWGTITGTLSNQTDLQNALNLKANLASPTFTGTVTAPTFVGALTGTASGNLTYSANQYGVLTSGAANVVNVIPPSSSTVFPLISGGASAYPAFGLLGTAGGGTGTATGPTQYGVVYGASSTSYASTAAGTLGFLLTSNNSSAPTYQSLNLGTSPALTGVLTHTNGGTDVSSPGTIGNILTSNGTSWVSQFPSGGGNFQVSQNLITNSGFEVNLNNWTASGGTFTRTTTTANIGSGTAAAGWDGSASSQTLVTTALATPAGLYGHSGVASCNIQGSGATHLIQAYDSTTSTILASTSITSAVAYARTSINFSFPLTNDNIQLRLVTVASNEPQIYIDDCYFGDAIYLNTFTALIAADATLGYTWVPTNAGTVSNAAYSTKRIGDTAIVDVQFQTGTTIASPASIGLPSGLTINTAVLGTDHQDLGICYDKNDLNAGIFSTNGLAQVAFYDGSTNDRLFIAYQDGSNAFQKNDAVNLWNAGDKVSCRLQVPITEWANTGATYRADQFANSWSGYHHNDCDFSYAGSNNTYHNPSTSNCTFSERTNRNFGTVVSAGSAGAFLPGIVFTPSRAGTYHVCATVPTYQFTGGVLTSYRIWDGTTTVATTQGIISSTVPNMYGSAAMCGDYVANSTAPITLTIQGATDDSTAVHLESGPGSNDAGASVVEWSIFQIDQSFPMPMLLPNTVIARALGNPGSTSAGSPIIFPTVSYDTNSAYNASTGEFTCPMNGYYMITGALLAGAQYGVYIYKNGVLDSAIGYAPSASGSTSYSGTVQCNIGQTLDIRPDNSTGSAATSSSVSFTRIQ